MGFSHLHKIHIYLQLSAWAWQMWPEIKIKINGLDRPWMLEACLAAWAGRGVLQLFISFHPVVPQRFKSLILQIATPFWWPVVLLASLTLLLSSTHFLCPQVSFSFTHLDYISYLPCIHFTSCKYFTSFASSCLFSVSLCSVGSHLFHYFAVIFVGFGGDSKDKHVYSIQHALDKHTVVKLPF